jgi:hypothetical protein
MNDAILDFPFSPSLKFDLCTEFEQPRWMKVESVFVLFGGDDASCATVSVIGMSPLAL